MPSEWDGWGTFEEDVVDQDEHGWAVQLGEHVHNFPLCLVLDVLIDLLVGSGPVPKVCHHGVQLIVMLGVCGKGL